MTERAVQVVQRPHVRRRLVCIPIPSRSAWRFVHSANDCPPGFMIIGEMAVSADQPGLKGRRETSKNLVSGEGITGPPADLERLLRAWTAMDDASRAEVLRHAEALAGAAP